MKEQFVREGFPKNNSLYLHPIDVAFSFIKIHFKEIFQLAFFFGMGKSIIKYAMPDVIDVQQQFLLGVINTAVLSIQLITAIFYVSWKIIGYDYKLLMLPAEAAKHLPRVFLSVLCLELLVTFFRIQIFVFLESPLRPLLMAGVLLFLVFLCWAPFFVAAEGLIEENDSLVEGKGLSFRRISSMDLGFGRSMRFSRTRLAQGFYSIAVFSTVLAISMPVKLLFQGSSIMSDYGVLASEFCLGFFITFSFIISSLIFLLSLPASARAEIKPHWIVAIDEKNLVKFPSVWVANLVFIGIFTSSVFVIFKHYSKEIDIPPGASLSVLEVKKIGDDIVSLKMEISDSSSHFSWLDPTALILRDKEKSFSPRSVEVHTEGGKRITLEGAYYKGTQAYFGRLAYSSLLDDGVISVNLEYEIPPGKKELQVFYNTGLSFKGPFGRIDDFLRNRIYVE